MLKNDSRASFLILKNRMIVNPWDFGFLGPAGTSYLELGGEGWLSQVLTYSHLSIMSNFFKATFQAVLLFLQQEMIRLN